MIRIKSRSALILLVIALTGLVSGGWMLWNAFETYQTAFPPALAFVALAIAVVALLIDCKNR